MRNLAFIFIAVLGWACRDDSKPMTSSAASHDSKAVVPSGSQHAGASASRADGHHGHHSGADGPLVFTDAGKQGANPARPGNDAPLPELDDGEEDAGPAAADRDASVAPDVCGACTLAGAHYCSEDEFTWECSGRPPEGFGEALRNAGCREAPTGWIRFCCPIGTRVACVLAD